MEAKQEVNPSALTPAALAALLSRAGGTSIDEAWIRADVAAGAPANADGTLHLVRYAAWLARETTRGERGTPGPVDAPQ